MPALIADIPPTLATFILAVLVLVAGVGLAFYAIRPSGSGPEASEHDKESMKYIFAAVGVLFGLLAAGGLGSLFAKQAADSSAEATAEATGQQNANLKAAIPGKVQQAVEDSVPGAVEQALQQAKDSGGSDGQAQQP